jgi:hypothetical protein
MKFARLSLLMLSIVLAAVLAFAAKDLVYGMVVLPLSYTTWQFGILFRAVPQLVWWTAVVVTVALVLGWQLVPEIRPAATSGVRPPRLVGEVEEVARWLGRSRRSTYFRWQLAHRLGRVSRKLVEIGGRGSDAGPPSARVEAYIAAGMNSSFVDFPAPRHPLARPRPTPLDVDPGEVVDYLESQSLMNRGNHADRL